MSKRIISIILTLVMVASVGTMSCFSAAVDSDSGEAVSLKGKAEIELAGVSSNDFNPDSEEAENEIIEEAEKLPDSLDLRNYNGMNYVTPVKFQNPFGTCWAFSTAAAAEISYLYDNGLGVPAGEENNTVDFSEKYIAWYMYHGITEDDVMTGAVRASQIGEGLDASEAESKDINSVYSFGGYAAYASNLFASGHGPVSEDMMIDDDYPYYYAGKNRWRQNDRNESEEVAALRKAYFKERYRSSINTFIRDGYIQSADEYDEWFDENWSEGFFLYTKSFARSNYAGYDDWSLPLNAEYRFPGVASYFKNSTMLPAVAEKDENGSYVFNEVGIAAIKTELANGHGVTINYYGDQSKPGQELGDTGYMNTTNWAQYTNCSFETNHSVCIVGYDDNYPKENFTRIAKGEVVEGSTPPGDGALIVKNSWGCLTDEDRATVTYDVDGNPVYANPNASAWGYEDSGYFYLSYYDQNINNPESFTFYKSSEIKYYGLNYDQYDLLQGGDYASFGFAEDVKTSNIFDAEEDEFLCQISYMVMTPRTTVHYAVYKDVEDSDPSSGVLLEEGENTHALGGYQRVDLQGEYFLHKGEKYAVVISQKHDSDQGALSDVVLSYTVEDLPDIRLTGVINPGESYMQINGEWFDLAEDDNREMWIDFTLQVVINDRGEEKFNQEVLRGRDGIAIDNFPIKAFLVPASIRDVAYILGDADLNNKVDAADVTTIQRCDAQMTQLDYIAATLADVDGDYEISILDATWVQRYLVELKAPEGIGKTILLTS